MIRIIVPMAARGVFGGKRPRADTHVRKVTTMLDVASPGYHTLKFWMVNPDVVLEKLAPSATVQTAVAFAV